MRVKDQVVVITGAASGIGYGCAQRFAAEGAKVVLSDIDQAKGEEAAERLQGEGAEAVFVACDVGDRAQVTALVDSAVAAFGRLDVMVANAGIVKGATSSTSPRRTSTRSEERRVGKECVSTCRSRCSTYH